jgi:hypothetical protein
MGHALVSSGAGAGLPGSRPSPIPEIPSAGGVVPSAVSLRGIVAWRVGLKHAELARV